MMALQSSHYPNYPRRYPTPNHPSPNHPSDKQLQDKSEMKNVYKKILKECNPAILLREVPPSLIGKAAAADTPSFMPTLDWPAAF